MVNGPCDEGGRGVWGGLVLDEFVDIPLVGIDPTMGTLRDLVGGDYSDEGEDGDVSDPSTDDDETADVDDLRTRATRPLGEELD